MILSKEVSSVLGIVPFVSRKHKTTNAGNGYAVPVYKLNDKGQPRIVCTVNGEVLTHNLQADINKMAEACDYRNLIKNGGVINTSVDWSNTDYTKIGNANELLRVKNMLDERGISLEQLTQMYDILANTKAKAGEVKQEVKQEVPATEQKEVK